MNADDFIELLGLTSDDRKVKAFLGACGITKAPKLKGDDYDAYLKSEKLGIEITFTDERHLDVESKEYEDGSLVLSNVRMYGDGSETFKRFSGNLPHGLKFEFGRKEAKSTLGKPAEESKFAPIVRWDFKGYCVFVRFDKKLATILEVDVQLPLQ